MAENSRRFNDGDYHVVRYIRTGRNTTLYVDSLPVQTISNPGTLLYIIVSCFIPILSYICYFCVFFLQGISHIFFKKGLLSLTYFRLDI